MTYLVAATIVVVVPGPDNVLVVSRGLSQEWVAAAASSCGAALGIMIHSFAATLGISQP